MLLQSATKTMKEVMKSIILFFCTVIILSSCTKPDPNLQFDAFKNRYISDLWKMYPEWASSVGFHDYDSLLTIPNNDARLKSKAFAESTLSELKKFDLNLLSDNNKTDYRLIENSAQGTIWSIDEEKSFEWNPSNYNVAGVFAEMLNGSYDSLENRLRMISYRLKNVPAYYEAAKSNIKNPTKEHTALAIKQNLGGLSVFQEDLKTAVEKSKLAQDEKQQISGRAAEAISAIRNFADYLTTMKNEAPRSFRLGPDLYAKKFEFDIQPGYTAEQVYDRAVQHKKEVHAKMVKIAHQLWEQYMGKANKPADSLKMVKMLIDKISLNHVKPEEFQSSIEKQIPELTKFVQEKDLLYLDPTKPLVVRKEPDYMAGVAGASISAPGPYDKNGNTYYNVGSLSGWSKEQSESYLREYNFYLMQILNIHEAIPGHYAQLVYSNQSPSMIKSILGNGAMIEGWAVYTELMMLENGYGGNSPELWLMYYKWNLRVTCNTILDISVHTKNMSKEDALHLLINEAFQQQAEADGKWNRVNLTSVQLCSYFSGFTEIYDFREELKQQQKDKFSLKQFHEKFLSYGSAPVKYIKEMMMKEDQK